MKIAKILFALVLAIALFVYGTYVEQYGFNKFAVPVLHFSAVSFYQMFALTVLFNTFLFDVRQKLDEMHDLLKATQTETKEKDYIGKLAGALLAFGIVHLIFHSITI